MTSASARVRIDATLDDDGSIRSLWLWRADCALVLTDEVLGVEVELPAAALLVTLRRYGRPLEAVLDETGEVVALDEEPHGPRVRRATFRGFVDVEANDHIVLEEPGREAIAAPARLVAAALRALTRAR